MRSTVTTTLQALGIDQLSIAERLRLVEEIWDSISDDVRELEMPDWHRLELDRRIAAADANPSAALSWDDVKASLRSEP
jgi:putative addiction module component (TIGR02574 family)